MSEDDVIKGIRAPGRFDAIIVSESDALRGVRAEAVKCHSCLNSSTSSPGPVSPDGTVVAVNLGGKKGTPLEVWFLDARTLETRGKLIGKGDPQRYWLKTGQFTPDGKHFIAPDGVGNVLVWDVTGRKVERAPAEWWGHASVATGR